MSAASTDLDSEWTGVPHQLIVTSVTPPDGPLDDGALEYELLHPGCLLAWHHGAGRWWLELACPEGEMEREQGLAGLLAYSGTPVTEPGDYRVRAWGRRYYVYGTGSYEYDASVELLPEGSTT